MLDKKTGAYTAKKKFEAPNYERKTQPKKWQKFVMKMLQESQQTAFKMEENINDSRKMHIAEEILDVLKNVKIRKMMRMQFSKVKSF